MARREFLSPAQRAELLALPSAERDLVRFYSLSASDLMWVRKYRWGHNRLGFAVQLCFFKHPGRVWSADEALPPAMLRFIARQVEASPASLTRYAARDQTRREHLVELQQRLGWRLFNGMAYRDLSRWLMAPARSVDRGIALVEAVMEELRRWHILAPRLNVLERLAREIRRRARLELYNALSTELHDAQRVRLDALLTSRPESRYTTLGWLREVGGTPGPANILKRIERVCALREIGIPVSWATRAHPNRIKQLAREGIRVTTTHLREYEPTRRVATLVAIVLETTATLIDEIFEMHERTLGGCFKKAQRAYEEGFAASGRAINEKVVLYAKVGHALIETRQSARDPFAAIDALMPWDQFLTSVSEAEDLARDEGFDYLERLTDYYGQLRRYTPTLLDAFEFRPTAGSQLLVDALNVLRTANTTASTDLPKDVPTRFVRPRWVKHVFREGGAIDLRFYEFAAMSEMVHLLRSGDLSVEGSRQFKPFDDYLIEAPVFRHRLRERRVPLAIETEFNAFFDHRAATLEDELTRVNDLAARNELPDAEITESGLKVTPLAARGSEALDYWSERAYRLLPQVRITDLLAEVDRWTQFTARFTHLRSGDPPTDTRLVLTAILADAVNLGLTRMAFACPGTSLAQLIQTADWFLRDETYSNALAELINHHHQLPLALEWGSGTTSSSDGQRFSAGAHGEAFGQVNARYGHTPSVMFYSHVSDQYTPFHTKVIHATVRDATHVLDGPPPYDFLGHTVGAYCASVMEVCSWRKQWQSEAGFPRARRWTWCCACCVATISI